MQVSVYYRGCMGKLHQIDVPDVKNHSEAIAWVADEMKSDPFAKQPFLASLPGGKK